MDMPTHYFNKPGYRNTDNDMNRFFDLEVREIICIPRVH